ncbi:MAG: alanine--tRNA ligase [Bdellovibrionales bacterium]|nr:alanine--tRNA ligase [Bdellovibrionales bacterium]
MKTKEIRKAFLEYFASKGHTVVPSSAVVPENDPTILFTNAGMNQFKDCFLGAEKRDYVRAASCQKCIRISGKHNDLENVGVTARHHTFFEMLGNFSFGDYFKEDAIKFAWEFVTDILKLDKKRLWATVHVSDDEAEALWKQHSEIPQDKILRLDEDNFWAMGDTGPCGPSSEIFYYLGEDLKKQSKEDFLKDDGTYIEIWNLVFMQYNRSEDGLKTPLPMQSVDTGAGLERIAAIMQGKKSNWDSDLLRSIIAKVEKVSEKKYDGSSYKIRDLQKDTAYATDVAMRVIADHARMACFSLADGVMPSSDGRGYVLRRVIRRAIRHGKVLEFKDPFFAGICNEVISLMGDHYKELVEKRDHILKVADAEEKKFYETLDSGLEILKKEANMVKPGKLFSGKTAFTLHDTYGFPLDLTQDALKAYSLSVDVDAFNKAMSEQKERSRDDRKSQGISYTAHKVNGDATKFLGYSEINVESKLQDILGIEQLEKEQRKKFLTGDKFALVFEETPFYAESGGQVSDLGIINFNDAKLEVLDVQKTPDGHFVHSVNLVDGELDKSALGKKATLEIDITRRNLIKTNHSATHLVHSALRMVLGDHVKQAGSRVDDKTLRFDYSHFEPVSNEQLDEIQSIVNKQIRSNHEVQIKEMKLEDAKKIGAMALFGEKYSDIVRVVEIGPDSLELCGGTHVERSGDIGFLMLANEGGISSGVRRIECWSGLNANQNFLLERAQNTQIAQMLKAGDKLPERVEKMLARTRDLEKELEILKSRLASAATGDLSHKTRISPNGIKVIAEKVEDADPKTLRDMVDKLKNQLGTGVVALASSQKGKGLIVAGVTSNLTDSLNAEVLVKEVAADLGGKGGGRADFAQAGGVDPAKLGSALEKLFTLVS